MLLGYACKNESLGKLGSFRSLTVKRASTMDEADRVKLIKQLTLENLETTFHILQWNVLRGIYMYRVSSRLVVLDNHELNTWDWVNDSDVKAYGIAIRMFCKEHNIRLSLHPDQFCVLNSHKPEVVDRAVSILEHQNEVANLLGINTIVLHVGGTEGGKLAGSVRFMDNFKRLHSNIQEKIVLENDDKSYNSYDVLNLCEILRIPMVLDIHHDTCNPDYNKVYTYIYSIYKTWNNHPDKPKVHLSTGATSKTNRKHANYVTYEDFKSALELLDGYDFDIMIEAKKKELSVLDLMEV
jgi:UV DNA damage endonuclease